MLLVERTAPPYFEITAAEHFEMLTLLITGCASCNPYYLCEKSAADSNRLWMLKRIWSVFTTHVAGDEMLRGQNFAGPAAKHRMLKHVVTVGLRCNAARLIQSLVVVEKFPVS